MTRFITLANSCLLYTRCSCLHVSDFVLTAVQVVKPEFKDRALCRYLIVRKTDLMDEEQNVRDGSKLTCLHVCARAVAHPSCVANNNHHPATAHRQQPWPRAAQGPRRGDWPWGLMSTRGQCVH